MTTPTEPQPPEANELCVCGHKVHSGDCWGITTTGTICHCQEFTPAPAAATKEEKCENCGAESDAMHYDSEGIPICSLCVRELGDSELSPAATSKPDGEEIEDLVCADIRSRQEVGRVKYPTTVAKNTAPLKEWLNHQYQELLDAAIYCRRAIKEIEDGE